MRFSKSSLVLSAVLLAQPALALERFSSKACLEGNFKTKIAHRGPLFGLLPHELVVEKKNCLVKVSYRRYLPKEWVIDVCREPVHIKVAAATGTDVAKKVEECVKPDRSRNTSDFCGQYFDLVDVIQDDGLIFAEGDRDSLSTPHGRTYCTYLLLERYLTDNVLFSRYTDVQSVFDKPSHAVAPTVTPVDAAPATQVAPTVPAASETPAPAKP
jgi:hypothetical protein